MAALKQSLARFRNAITAFSDREVCGTSVSGAQNAIRSKQFDSFAMANGRRDSHRENSIFPDHFLNLDTDVNGPR